MSFRKRIKVRLVIHLAQVEGRLCELAEQALLAAAQGGDLAPIEDELDALDEVLGPDPSRAGGGC
jgi:hypothetical protein